MCYSTCTVCICIKYIYCILQKSKYCNIKHYSKYTVLQYSAHCWITYLFCLWNVWIIKGTVVLPTFGCTLTSATAIVRPWLRTSASSTSSSVLPPYPSSCSLTPLLLNSCWFCSFPCCSSIRNYNTVLCSVYICLPIEGSWAAELF